MAARTKSFRTPDYWRNRAEEARKRAEQMSHADAKAAMLRVVASYERLAGISGGEANKEAAGD